MGNEFQSTVDVDVSSLNVSWNSCCLSYFGQAGCAIWKKMQTDIIMEVYPLDRGCCKKFKNQHIESCWAVLLLSFTDNFSLMKVIVFV